MKRILFSIFFLIPLVCSGQFKDSAYAELLDGENASSMREQVRRLSAASMEGRRAGSEGEKEAAEYVTEVLDGYGVDILSGKEGELFGIKQESGDTLTSRNVLGFIPGYDAQLKDHYVVIGARLDNLGVSVLEKDGERVEKIYFGANGNASGLSLMMQLARMLSANRVLLKRSVIFAAFGSSLEMGAGAWYFLNRSFPDVENIDAMVNLDMLGTGSRGFYAYTASNEDLSNIVRRLSSTLQPLHPKLVSMEPVGSDHRMFYDKEIPAILFTTGMYPEYNTEKDTPGILEYDYMERELEYLYNFSLDLVNGPAPDFRPQEKVARKHSDTTVYSYADVDVRPAFLNNPDPVVFMNKWVYTYLKYPQGCIAEGVQGKVLVDFIIDEKGKVTDVTVLRGVDQRLDDEAVRVISASPDWRPARVRGQRVKCEMSLYVEFKLEKKRK